MRRSPHLIPRPAFPADFVARQLRQALAVGGQPTLFAIAGLPGSGKGTLAAQLVRAAKAQGRSAVALSLDDFYLTRRERQALARAVHPLLAARGPPGTHDLDLAGATLDGLAAGASRLPRFDKLGDCRLPPSRWRRITARPDLVVFEGWFLKTPPQSAEDLASPLNALERDLDDGGRWRCWCNAALGRYEPLWRRFDHLLFLQPPGWELAGRWRWQQERALLAAQPQRKGMSRAAVGRFLQRFERVGRQALRTLPAIADAVVRLDARRRPLD